MVLPTYIKHEGKYWELDRILDNGDFLLILNAGFLQTKRVKRKNCVPIYKIEADENYIPAANPYRKDI